jgi:FkbM family methyltransferase
MNVFIDLGSHVGKTIKMFMKSKQYTPDFQIHAFEANPLVPRKYPKGVIEHRCAAWITEDTIKFYVNRKKLKSQCASVFKQKTSGHLDKKHPIMVPCVDFSKWVKANFKETDNIIVKSDIEGAEYHVFGKMIADGTIRYIKKVYMDERHYDRIGVSLKEDRDFITELRKHTEVHDDYRF